jgi:hypothetical protein
MGEDERATEKQFEPIQQTEMDRVTEIAIHERGRDIQSLNSLILKAVRALEIKWDMNLGSVVPLTIKDIGGNSETVNIVCLFNVK